MLFPLLRKIEPKNPKNGLSLIAVGTKPVTAAHEARAAS